MRLYVASHGEKHEGSYILGIFDSEQAAIKACLNAEPCFDGGWTPCNHNVWENGCDYVKVQEFILNTEHDRFAHLGIKKLG